VPNVTLVTVEGSWRVEPAELSEMLLDAIRQFDSDICDPEPTTFSVEQFDTQHTDTQIAVRGEGRVMASLCERETDYCRVQFAAVGIPPEEDGLLLPVEISVWITEDVVD